MKAAILVDSIEVGIACPFVQKAALEPFLAHRPGGAQVIARFNLAEIAGGVGDFKALRRHRQRRRTAEALATAVVRLAPTLKGCMVVRGLAVRKA